MNPIPFSDSDSSFVSYEFHENCKVLTLSYHSFPSCTMGNAMVKSNKIGLNHLKYLEKLHEVGK